MTPVYNGTLSPPRDAAADVLPQDKPLATKPARPAAAVPACHRAVLVDARWANQPVRQFLQKINWSNAPQNGGPARPAMLGGWTLQRFLKAINWADIAPAALSAADVAPNPFAVETVLAEFVWD